MSTASNSLRAANGGVDIASQGFNLAAKGLRASKSGLSGIKETFKAGTKAFGFIADLGLNGLIRIHKISFEVSLSKASTGRFPVTVDATVLKQRIKETIPINLADITGIAKQLAKDAGSGLDSLFD